MSYARFDDTHDDGQLSAFRERLAAEVRAQTGREFEIFQDRADIAWGQNWRQRIDEALDVVTLLLVVITPGFFRSSACRDEVERFRERERALGRSDLILPVYYISAREMDDPEMRASDEVAGVLASRQFADWRELRFEPLTSPVARRAVAQLASRMRDTFWQPVPVPARPVGERGQRTQAAGSAGMAPVAPEVAELAAQLAERPDALGIIYEVFDRTLAVAPLGASVPQLLTRLHELVQSRGEAPLLQQVRELAAQTVNAVPDPVSTDQPGRGLRLLVAICEDSYDSKTLRLSLTLFQDGQPGQPQQCGSPPGSLKDMKEPLRVLLPAILGSRRGLPLVEFAVPQALLGEDFDQWPMPSRAGGPKAEDYRLGEKYPVVVRDVDRLNPRNVSEGDRDMWESRWKVLLACEGPVNDVVREAELHEETLHSLRASLWDSSAAGNAVLALLPAPGPAGGKPDKARKAVRELIRAGFDAGVPAAIWLRPPASHKARMERPGTDGGEDDDRTYLKNALYLADADLPARPRDLPQRIRSLRLRAEATQQGKFHPGHRLSLLWEAPIRSWTPPELQLPSRSSNGDDL